jgi:hypothetical protein
MINRLRVNHLLEDVLSAGILMLLCAIIMLGPQPESSERKVSGSTERTGTSGADESPLSSSPEVIHQASMKYPNQ